VPARYLLACANGHLDEFPYTLWVHHGHACPAVRQPDLKLLDSNVGQGAAAVVVCQGCEQRRGMSEAQGETGKAKLPACRGRHPHLNAFDSQCGLDTTLMMMGASNLFFAATQSIIVMPRRVVLNAAGYLTTDHRPGGAGRARGPAAHCRARRADGEVRRHAGGPPGCA
jgi:hypothetical protein